MRSKKSKAMKIYQQIHQKTCKDLLDQMENDQEAAGTVNQKETSKMCQQHHLHWYK